MGECSEGIPQEPITRVWATPILGLTNSIFTDWFIFRHILGHFFRQMKYPPRLWVHLKYKISRSVGFANWFSCQNHSKNKLVHENAMKGAHGSYLLVVIGSCLDHKMYLTINFHFKWLGLIVFFIQIPNCIQAKLDSLTIRFWVCS